MEDDAEAERRSEPSAAVGNLSDAAAARFDGAAGVDARVGAGSFPPLAANDRPLRFGADQAGKYPLVGDLDRVRLHGRALTAPEILAEAGHRYAPCDRERACLGEWTFDDQQNGVVASSGPTPLPARLVGAVELVDGIEGKAARLRGGYVQIESDAALAVASAVTYSAWVKLSSVCPLAQGAGGCARMRLVDKASWLTVDAHSGHAHLEVAFAQPGPFKSQMGVPKRDEWAHLAVTFDASAIDVYVNGKLNKSHFPQGVQFTLVPNTKPLRLGANASAKPGDFYVGDLDSVRFYRRALNPQEIGAEAAQRPEACTDARGCVVEWTFDNAQAMTVPSAAGAKLTGLLGGGVELVDGIVGKAVRFDRGWMEVPSDPALDFKDAFTFSAWLRRAATCPPDRSDKCYLERVFGKGDLVGEIREGNWRVILGDKFMLSPSNTGAKPGQWSHLAVAFDTVSGLRIWLDGKLVRAWLPGKADNLCYNCPGNPS